MLPQKQFQVVGTFPHVVHKLIHILIFQLHPVHRHHLSAASTKNRTLENKGLSLRHKQSHRGAGPKDERLFGVGAWPALRLAMNDLCWLLNRGYASRSTVELVGNRHSLTSRQRLAITRCACTKEENQRREARRIEPDRLREEELWLDGYNVLTLLEAALAGGIVLLGRDGCCRDVAGIHRRYRKVQETIPALQLIGELTADWGVSRCQWLLDKPVSNSGRLNTLILEAAADAGCVWQVVLAPDPDRLLAQTDHIVATSDSVILDRCQRWFNLARLAIARRIPHARLVDLSSDLA
jgi:hypothetical protein